MTTMCIFPSTTEGGIFNTIKERKGIGVINLLFGNQIVKTKIQIEK
jgi:hypothetical protein